LRCRRADLPARGGRLIQQSHSVPVLKSSTMSMNLLDLKGGDWK
jgi:hypothetical protein